MSASADSSTSVGMWVWDATRDKWTWFVRSRMATATYKCESDITCDGTPQPGNKVIGPPGAPLSKFTGGPPPAGAAFFGVSGPFVLKSFTGPAGSIGETLGRCKTRVSVRGFPHIYMVVRARARPAAAGGTATAISTVDDPFDVSFDPVTNPGDQLVQSCTLRLRGRMPAFSAKPFNGGAFAYSGSPGTVAVMHDSNGKPKASVFISPGWAVCMGFPFTGAGAKKQALPVVDADRAARMLTKAYRTGGTPPELTFVRPLASQGGSASLTLSTSAMESAMTPVRIRGKRREKRRR